MDVLTATNMILEEGARLDASANSLETPDAQRANRMLERVRLDVLSQGQPYNIEIVDLPQNSAGQVVVPPNYLALELTCPYEVRNRKIYDPQNRTYVVATDFTSVRAAMDVAFDQLPQIPANAIAWQATARFCASILGAQSPQYAYCQREANKAAVAVSVEYPVQMTPKFGARNIRRSAYLTGSRYSPSYPDQTGSIRWCACGG